MNSYPSYPSDMPPNCPLPAATPCNNTVFRACQKNPPASGDFQTHAELGLAANARGEKACMRFGLSVFPTREDCAHMLSLFPSNGIHVASGMLTQNHGTIAATKGRLPNHLTWWPFEGVDRVAPFA